MSTRWKAIEATEVLGEFTPQERISLQAIQGTGDSLGEILRTQVLRWRGAIRAAGTVMDDASDDTVPDQCRTDIVAVARWRWLISFPALKALQTADRKEAYTSAEKRLDDIAAGKLLVESGDSADGSPQPGPRFPTTRRVRRYDRECSQDGI